MVLTTLLIHKVQVAQAVVEMPITMLLEVQEPQTAVAAVEQVFVILVPNMLAVRVVQGL